MESDWEVEERTKRTYTTTGIITTDGDFSKLFPDFYNKLKRTQNLITKDSKRLKDLMLGYQKQLKELQKEEKQLLSIFRNSDIEMKKDYKGYGNLKNYLTLRKHRMNRIDDDLPAIGLDDIFVLPKTNKISFWGAYDTDINGYNLYNLKNDLYDNLHRQGTMYEEMIKFLDDLGLPYEYVFNYV